MTPSLKPFWYYFGGKWRAAPRYPKPLYDTIVEPFAGAAGYACRYPDRSVILVDKYPVIVAIWRYLVAVSPRELLRIPDVEHVDALPSWVPQEARWLVGFWFNAAATSPRKQLSAGRRRARARGNNFEGWSPAVAERIASQVAFIRHWKILEGDYTGADVVGRVYGAARRATWFVDPPYQIMGKHYVHSEIDYAALGRWCMERRGQTLVCEASGASWLPFKFFGSIRVGPTRGVSHEVLWEQHAH